MRALLLWSRMAWLNQRASSQWSPHNPAEQFSSHRWRMTQAASIAAIPRMSSGPQMPRFFHDGFTFGKYCSMIFHDMVNGEWVNWVTGKCARPLEKSHHFSQGSWDELRPKNDQKSGGINHKSGWYGASNFVGPWRALLSNLALELSQRLNMV